MARPPFNEDIKRFYEDGGYVQKRKETSAEKKRRIQMALYGSSNMDFSEPTGMAGGGSAISNALKFIAKKAGGFQAQRLQRAADLANLKPYNEQALVKAFTGKDDFDRMYGVIKPSEFERYAYPLDPKSAQLTPELMPGLSKDWYTKGDENITSLGDYVQHLQNVAKSGFNEVPELYVGQGTRWDKNTPRITGHEGRHRMRALDEMGDQPALVQFNPDFGKGSDLNLDDVVNQSKMVYPQNATTLADKIPWPSDMWAHGGRVGFASLGHVSKYLKDLAGYSDRASQFINDWKWRPLSDVAKDLGTTEVPQHVLNYGDFMKQMAKTAGTEGLSPEDLTKAYATTRMSMQRQALNPDTLRATGFNVAGDDKVRPEGAISSWFNSPTGARYLRQAGAGITDDSAIAQAQKYFAPYGKPQDVNDFLSWAPRNLPGREGRASELIDRAAQGQSDPSEWRDFMSGMRGIGPAKQGFFSSLIGRGDIPTLDARQVVLHTGQPTSASVPYISKPNRSAEGVQRLADRQSALGLSLPSEYDPFYQHLAHHTVWDRVGDETTTHQDVIDSMLNRARGGRIGFAKGTELADTIRWGADLMKRIYGSEQAARKAVAAAPEVNLAGDVGQRTGKTTEQVIEDLRARKAGVRGATENVTGITSQMGTPYDTASAAMLHPDATKWRRPATTQLEDLVGGVGVSGMSDRTRAGTIIGSYGGVPLKEPLITSGGSDFPLYFHDLWASGKGPLQGMTNALNDPRLAEQMKARGLDPDAAQHFYFNKLMGRQQSADQSHMAQVLSAHALENAPMSRDTRKAFDDYVRNYQKTISGDYVKPLEDYPGSASKKQLSYLLQQPMSNRAGLLEAMDSAKFNLQGVPNPSGIRLALMDPALHNLPEGVVGRAVGSLDRADPINFDPTLRHPSYPAGFRGTMMGSTEKPMMPWELFPDWWKGKDPSKATTWSSWRTSPATQIFDQQWLDTAAPALEQSQMRWGQARGGPIKYAFGGAVGARKPTRDQLRYHTAWWQEEDWSS